MKKEIHFTKMEGTGNDYVYIDLFQETVEDPAALAISVSHRRRGIGSDGLILIAPSERADVKMIMFNADGSQSEMCGNGIRCLGKYAWDHGIVNQKKISVETLAGVLELDLIPGADNKIKAVKVNMGQPRFRADQIPCTLSGERFIDEVFHFNDFEVRGTLVSMGNPHMVVFVDQVKAIPLEKWGPLIENDPRFPNRLNIEFVQVVSTNEVIQRTWERGSGETWACGTGASAVCVAGILTGRTATNLLIHLTGGDLELSWEGEGFPVLMQGEAKEVYTGVWPC